MSASRERQDMAGGIDFLEILGAISEGRLLVLKFAVLGLVFGAIYLFFAPQRYEAHLFVIPPTQNDIAQFNYGRGGSAELPLVTVKEVYISYVRNLMSESLRRQFFKDVYLPSLPEDQKKGLRSDLYRQLNASVDVVRGGRDQSDRYLITAKSEDPEVAAQWVTAYAKLAGERAKHELLSNVLSDASIKADNLQKQITGEQEGARREREDRIARLKEALRIARSVGLVKPPIISAELTAQMSGALTYMRGSNALEAEISSLEARASDDPFIDDLRKMEIEVGFYRTLKIDPSTVEVYQQDGDLALPDRPAGPRSVIVLAIALLLGAGVGVGVAICRQAWIKRRVLHQ
ncbi:Wzz/FepE/Etk N-terminal domain-containing protein [Pseudomonas wayambapalatensis]|uniref:Wzz/FepE/Etk N-terminal domain-containing protein n=1 Tax=Pseudomonas wayambapalatensis TaxID=485895 RepID=UPI003CF41E81